MEWVEWVWDELIKSRRKILKKSPVNRGFFYPFFNYLSFPLTDIFFGLASFAIGAVTVTTPLETSAEMLSAFTARGKVVV